MEKAKGSRVISLSPVLLKKVAPGIIYPKTTFRRGLNIAVVHHRLWRQGLLFCLLGVWGFYTGCSANQPNVLLRSEHPEWATPTILEGAPNLYKVSEDLYRGAQPTAEGMQALTALGVKTIVNLRSIHSDRDELGNLDVYYEHIHMMAFAPSEEDVIRFLHIITNPERVPVLVHCLHGADRTGLMGAVYRIVIQGWTKEAAIEEMTEGGFGYHSVFRNLISFIEDLDIEKIRKEVDIETDFSP